MTNDNDDTEAFLSRSTVNSDANFGGRVVVRAHTDDYLSIVTGGGAGGAVAVGGTVDHSAITSQTRAFITNQDVVNKGAAKTSEVRATGVEVSTVSREKIEAVVLGFVGGAIAVAGTVAVEDISATNEAYIQDSNVQSKGGLAVLANDTATLQPKVGTFTGGLVGAGAAVSVNSIKTTVEARVIGGELNATGALVVQATSHEDLEPLTGAGSLGVVGLAGAVSVNNIETTTDAQVVEGVQAAKINQDPKFQAGGAFKPGVGQSVTIHADDTAKLTTATGALATGVAGLGAAVDVATVRNRTVAMVGVKSRIDAVGDVAVLADGDHELNGNVIAAAGGALGLSGAVDILGLGGNSSAGQNEFGKSDKNNPNDSLMAQTGASVKPPSANTLDYTGKGNSAQAQKAQQDVAGLATPDLASDVGAADNKDKVTAAFVEDAGTDAIRSELHAGGNINVKATDAYEMTQLTGSLAGGIVGVGAGVGVVTVQNTTVAYLGTHDVLTGGGDVTIRASDEDKNASSVTTFGGAIGAVGASVNVATVNVTSRVDAYIAEHARVDQGAVTVEANQRGAIDAVGKGFGGAVAASAGEVAVGTTVTANVTAKVRDTASVGAPGSKATSLTVRAKTNNHATADVQVGNAAGGLSLNDGKGTVTVTDNPTARIGSADVYTTGGVLVDAASMHTANATVEALSGAAIAGGLAQPQTTVSGTDRAEVGTGAHVVGGSLAVTATDNSTTTATGKAVGLGVAAGTAADVTATVDFAVKAAIGAAQVTTTGATSLSADSTQTATATSGKAAIGVGAGGASLAAATTKGDTTAEIFDTATIDAQALSVLATRKATATTNAHSTDNGLGSANGVTGTSTVTGDIHATIGAATVKTVGDTSLSAHATRTADATTGQEAGAIFLAVGATDAKADVTGDVLASVVPGADLTVGKVVKGNLLESATSTDSATARSTPSRSPPTSTRPTSPRARKSWPATTCRCWRRRTTSARLTPTPRPPPWWD